MTKPATITMIDYGASNIRSAWKAFEYVGATVKLTADPDEVRRADKLVLPGVGAFGAGMAAIRAHDLDPAIAEAAARGVPLLGICLGMQFLFTESDEMGQHTGLDLIPGKVTRFPENLSMVNGQLPIANSDSKATFNHQSSIINLKVPHMGWNQLEPAWDHPLLAGVPTDAHAYFVHSYYCDPADPTHVLAWTDYGMPFCSVVARDNVFGVQFHPEKSQRYGLQILSNYLAMEVG